MQYITGLGSKDQVSCEYIQGTVEEKVILKLANYYTVLAQRLVHFKCDLHLI
jgi:hypothetical protein